MPEAEPVKRPSPSPPAEPAMAARPATAQPSEHGPQGPITSKTPVAMSLPQFGAILIAVIGGAYWAGTHGVTKDDLDKRAQPIEARLGKIEEAVQDIRTTLAVLKDRSDRDQKKTNQ